MGYSEVGGNGSVEWKIEADEVDWTTNESKKEGTGRGHRQCGSDKCGKPGHERFTISVEVPRDEDPEKFLKKLERNLQYDAPTRRVWFTLPIESKNPDQIRIAWPPHPPLPTE